MSLVAPHTHPVYLHPPTEILQDIFQRACLPSAFNGGGTGGNSLDELATWSIDSLDPRNPIWVFSQVCRHWRRAAFAPDAGSTVSKLWSTVVLGDNFTAVQREAEPRKVARRLNRALYRLARQLERSNNHPLDIRILIRGTPRLDILAPFLALFATYRARWQSIVVQDSRSKVPVDFWQTIHSMISPTISRKEVAPSSFPSVGEFAGGLDLQRSMHVNHLASDTPPVHLPYGPLENLTSLRAVGVSLPRQFVPWAQLQNLEISRCSVNDAVSILPRLTSIRTLRVGSLQNDPRSFVRARLASCTLPHLTSLDIRDSNFSDEVLRHLTAPNLTHVYVPRLDIFYTPPPLLSLIERSHCDIISLETYTVQSPPEPEPFLSLLSAMPSLRNLKIGSGPMPEGLVDFMNPSPIITMSLNMIKTWLRVFLHHVLVEALARHATPAAFSHYEAQEEFAVSPELRHVSLRIPQMAADPFDAEPLLAMLDDRSKRGALRSVDIDFTTAVEPLSEEQIQCLRALGEGGLRVGAKWKDVEFGHAAA